VRLDHLACIPEDAGGYLWLHFNLAIEPARDWLRRQARLHPFVVENLLDVKSAQDLHLLDDGFMIALEDRSLDFDTETDELGEIRIWLDQHRVITGRRRPIAATNRLRHHLNGGSAPRSPIALLTALITEIVADIEHIVMRLRDRIDTTEDQVLTERLDGLSAGLGKIRREAILLRRHMAPKRQLLQRLLAHLPSWAEEDDRLYLAEAVDAVSRMTDQIAEAQERAKLLQEELSSRLAETTNRNLYIISIATVVMLPLNLITGIFGMNVGGLPGLDVPEAFSIVMVVMFALALVTLAALKLKRWF
jgi:zinc transporter